MILLSFFFLLEILHCLYSHFYCVLHFKCDFHFLVSQYIVKLFNIHRLHNVPKVTCFSVTSTSFNSSKTTTHLNNVWILFAFLRFQTITFSFNNKRPHSILHDYWWGQSYSECIFWSFHFPEVLRKKNLHLNYLKPGQNLTLLNIIDIGQRNKHEIKRSDFLAVSNYWEIHLLIAYAFIND